MDFAPFNKMWEKVEKARDDSDWALFEVLLEFCELVTKTSVLGMVSAVDDRNRDQYRQLYRLVRANGLGDWEQVLDEILTGPASQSLLAEVQTESRELTMRCPERTWQYSAVSDMHQGLRLLVPTAIPLQTKVAGKQWISIFVQVRNKSRGHGALSLAVRSQLCSLLESSLKHFVEGFSLFRHQWAYLHRNLSGRYRVTKITPAAIGLDWLKSARAKEVNFSVPNGVYVEIGHLLHVPLLISDVDGLDYLYPNGAPTGKRFELISYISGTVSEADISPFLSPPTELPGSETSALRALKEEGHTFGNLPPLQRGYITRERLQSDLSDILLDERHPVVTLVGRGGIGKTSLALSVLHTLVDRYRFSLILWFSARDIDLLPQGPKRVRADVLTVDEVAKEFLRLLQPLGIDSGSSDSEFFARSLTRSPFDNMPILFVFDNFETVRAPQDLYAWIDQNIRLPNKVLITTRSRDFKGDYPVEVSGMSADECDQLVDATATLLNITTPLDSAYRQALFQESEGHPYVIKVLLGEVKKTGRAVKVERIVASQDEMLNALFERTYNTLSPVAQRLFLTLSSWRSAVPQLAVEAVLLRPKNERMDVEHAVDELKQSSLIDISVSEDGSVFLLVPLVASVFGKRKLAVSPWRSAIEEDRDLLQTLGVVQSRGVLQGIGPRIERMFRNFAQRAAQNPTSLAEYTPIMQFVARKYPPAWLHLSEVLEENSNSGSTADAKAAVMSYLEVVDQPIDRMRGWERLAELCRWSGDIDGAAHALLELCQVPNIEFDVLSEAVNRFNSLGTFGYRVDTEEKQMLAKRAAQAMACRIDEASAIDCSRLAWLYHNIRDDGQARHYVELGLSRDPDNDNCDRLARRLKIY